MSFPDRLAGVTATDLFDGVPCLEVAPDVFFPEKGESSLPAKRLCRGCPVRTVCLDYALRHRERYGVWGGTSERERRRMMAAGRARDTRDGRAA